MHSLVSECNIWQSVNHNQEDNGVERLATINTAYWIMAGDSIRAKYADKIYQKKMLAEAKQEQAKLGIIPTANPSSPGASAQGWQAMPGAPALVRYIEVFIPTTQP